MTQETKKNKSNIIVAILLIIVLVAGGYYAYKNYVLTPQSVDTVQNVETKETALGNVSTGWDMDLDEISDIADSSDATCFYVDKEGTMSQMPKDEFIEKAEAHTDTPYSKASVITTTKVENLLTMSRQQMSDRSRLDNINGDSNMRCGEIDDFLAEDINARFGGSIDDYLDEHSIRLEASDVKIEKAIFMEYGRGVDVGDTWIFKVTGNMKTTNATGDISDLGIFADKGKTRNVTLYYALDIDDENFVNMIDLKVCQIK